MIETNCFNVLKLKIRFFIWSYFLFELGKYTYMREGKNYEDK